MAEVHKKKVEDKYNTSSIKIKEIKKETRKEVKKKKSSSDNKKSYKENKKGLFTKFRIFCSGVKQEFHTVHWTSKADMVKYSISTILFIIFCSLFFYLIDILFALVRSLFG